MFFFCSLQRGLNDSHWRGAMKDLTRPDLGDGLEARHGIREAIDLEIDCSGTIDAVGLQEAVEMVS